MSDEDETKLPEGYTIIEDDCCYFPRADLPRRMWSYGNAAARCRAHADQQRAIGAAQERKLMAGLADAVAAFLSAEGLCSETGDDDHHCDDSTCEYCAMARAFDVASARTLATRVAKLLTRPPPCPGIWHGPGALRGPRCPVCGAKGTGA